MLNINDLLETISTYLQSTPQVMQGIDGDEGALEFFSPSRPASPSYESKLSDMPWPGLLISHQGTNLGFRGEISQWRHTFRIDIKLIGEDGTSSYFSMMQALTDGIPEGRDGASFMQCAFSDDCDPMEDVSFSWERDVLTNKAFLRMDFALQERSANTSTFS